MNRRSALLALGSLFVASSALARDVEFFWSDRWNSAYHRFTDLDGDGLYDGANEVAFHMDPESEASFPAAALRTTIEDGQEVAYWLLEFDDLILRGVDANGDGAMADSEIGVFRDTGALDGESWPQDLDITDDGAVWWAAALSIANPQSGLSRLVDLNGDGDAADPGEQIVMVDGTGTHLVEHDLGTMTIEPWKIADIAAAGNGVFGYAGVDEHALYRFEDLNADGDVLDAGESILLLNPTGALPGVLQNPDFADGTFPSLETGELHDAYHRLIYLASAMEDGERAFYFGTDSGVGELNIDGDGVSFLIFRGVDGNGDGDVNDAGEVSLYFDGSSTGPVDLLLLRGLDALDGVVYAVGLKPYPALFPGPNGNTWIHRFEDLNGDGDARDPGEQQLEIFDLQEFGDLEVFPLPPAFGNMMADPWSFSVAPAAFDAWTVLDDGLAGTGGLVPTLSGDGGMLGGEVQTLGLIDALPAATAYFVLGTSYLGAPFKLGTLTPSTDVILPLTVDGTGGITFGFTWPLGVPSGVSLYYQYWIADPAGPAGFSASNGLQSTTP